MTEQNATKSKKYSYFIGIDVSKDKLDYAVMRGKDLLFHREAKNQPDEIIAFVGELKKLPGFTLAKAIFCMEATGIYGSHLESTLRQLKGNLNKGNPAHIKSSLGLTRGKSDKIDAIRIARYCWKNRYELRLLGQRRPVIQQLAGLIALRNRLLGLSLVLENPLNEQTAFIGKEVHSVVVERCEHTLLALKADLASLEAAVDRLIASDGELKRLNRIMMSVPGIGRITAMQLLICTNEFKDISNPRKFACYAGVAPFKKESGKGTGVFRARISMMANRKMKSLLHICALAAIRRDQRIKAYYERKTLLEKKPKMVVLNAVRGKLIFIAFACVKQGQLYSKDHIPQFSGGNYELIPLPAAEEM